MGYWSNLFDALLGRKQEPKVVVMEKPAQVNAPITPITVKEKASIKWSLEAFKNLSVKDRQTIKQTFDVLSNKPEDIASICNLRTNQAKYVAQVLRIDSKWADAVELSQYVDKEDVRMLWFFYQQCNDIGAIAQFFGLEEDAVKSYFDKMDAMDKVKGKCFTIFPKNSQRVRLGQFIDGLSEPQVKNMLRIFRKAKRLSAIRYVLPMYREVPTNTLTPKLFHLWEYAVKAEKKYETKQS